MTSSNIVFFLHILVFQHFYASKLFLVETNDKETERENQVILLYDYLEVFLSHDDHYDYANKENSTVKADQTGDWHVFWDISVPNSKTNWVS